MSVFLCLSFCWKENEFIFLLRSCSKPFGKPFQKLLADLRNPKVVGFLGFWTSKTLFWKENELFAPTMITGSASTSHQPFSLQRSLMATMSLQAMPWYPLGSGSKPRTPSPR